MKKELIQQFASSVKEGIANCLKENPGIEKKLDWFTLKADKNTEVRASKS